MFSAAIAITIFSSDPVHKRRVAFALIQQSAGGHLLYRYFEVRFKPNAEWQDLKRREEEGLIAAAHGAGDRPRRGDGYQ